ncbi:MAG: 3-phosphoshikimate 1-carboxyvinyltransferase [Deltaproteobacteria bacterium]|nr:3-phosphoshikimate 1-carboxyvinyltransferase [Deltaproteobacteria bacterium]MBW1874848.1 3-phosphoshikimate 1-carboxyvinyltransferase [Deltaproteobacteria bacterium]MBW2209578.1 3-phosphoshikimate 1-carboxyvinyltransferase [Deltaproteobacteria bacterium]MBW2213087.1 3-phosphoshikimate 1-carboxyvinyltransferase [Deltaproteobacteria bacterium]MBW2379436.1 3-phosphoshikimate 1-carboxyvinyltransferase [Deltaproteobacteria bacterium]
MSSAPKKRYRVRRSGPLSGSVRVPGDKSIGHRSLIFGALGRGVSRITGLSEGLDNAATRQAFRSMGVAVQSTDEATTVHGVGLRGLQMPTSVVDCGNSGTTMRLLAGLLTGQRFGTRMTGDESLTRRPMGRVIKPLRARGAHIAGTAGAQPDELYPPISIAPLVEGEALKGIEYSMPIASAQVKSALLLSGLYASGPTAIEEPVLSRDHTERMMLALGVPLQTAGASVVLDPNLEWAGGWEPFEWHVPGDPSSAAFPLLAAAMVPGSQVSVQDVCINPTRTGLFDWLRLLGASISHRPSGHGAGDEPMAEITVAHAAIRGSVAGGELIVRMIDEIPAVCALAAVSKGRTEIRDAAELRVKESDRIATMAHVLDAFGVPCEELPDGLIITGGARLRGAQIESRGDHRIAMAATLLGMLAEGESLIGGAEAVDTSFPGFVALLRSLGADIAEETL